MKWFPKQSSGKRFILGTEPGFSAVVITTASWPKFEWHLLTFEQWRRVNQNPDFVLDAKPIASGSAYTIPRAKKLVDEALERHLSAPTAPKEEAPPPAPRVASMVVFGVDAAPTKAYFVRVEFCDDGSILRVEPGEASPGWLMDSSSHLVAVEDPTGIIFDKTNSMLWSKTCRTAGEVLGRNPSAHYVGPQDARGWLGRAARQSRAPTTDSQVRQCLMAVYGGDAFDRSLVCPKRANKSHGPDCDKCGGSGIARPEGVLAPLATAHHRDALVVAAYLRHLLVTEDRHGNSLARRKS